MLNQLLKDKRVRRRDVISFLASLLLAFTFWVVHNLSLRYTSTVSVPVIVESNLPGRSSVSEYPVEIVARCRATGYDLLVSGKREVKVHIDPSSLQGPDGDFYTISAMELTNYAEGIFGSGVTLESFMLPVYKFKFAVENNKKVPVEVVSSISFKPEYCRYGKLVVEPDSVFVYGAPQTIANVDKVYTESISFSNVSSLKHGTTKLIVPDRTRLSESQIHFMIPVSRYIEIRKKLKISTRNVPENKSFRVFPSSADAVFRCAFPISDDLTRDVQIYVDHDDFTKSINGRCVARTDSLPSEIMDVRIEPQIFECFETEVE